MDFSFDETQEAIRDLAKKILGDLVTPDSLDAIEKGDDWFHAAAWAALKQSEVLGIAVPGAYGGGDLGMIELCLMLQHVGRTVAPIPLLPSLVMGALPIAEFGSDAQKRAILPATAAGDVILTAALQGEGSANPNAPSVKAVQDAAGDWVLHGTVIGVPFAHKADWIVVAADAGDGAGLFLVAADAAFHRETQVATNEEPLGRLTFESTPADPLGGAPSGGDSIRWVVERAQVGLAAVQLGVAEKALFMTAEYSGERKQFGMPIGMFQAVSQRTGDAYIDVQAMKVALWQAAWRLDQGGDASREVAIAKFWAAEGGHRVGVAAQHIHGGMGFDRDYPLHRYFLWAKRCEFSLGGANAQLAHLGRAIAARG